MSQPQEPLEHLAARIADYRVAFRKTVLALALCGAALVLSLSVNIILLNTQEPVEHRYFLQGQDGELLSLKAPQMSEADVTRFASQAAQSAYTMTFNNWRRQLKDVKDKYFVDEEPFKAFDAFMAGLRADDMIQTLEEKRISMTALVQGAPVIQRRFKRAGWQHWEVAFPLQIDFVSTSGSFTDDVQAKVVVALTPVHLTPKALSVQSIVTR